MTRNLPAKGRTGFGLTWHRMSILLPLPPARITAAILFITGFSFQSYYLTPWIADLSQACVNAISEFLQRSCRLYCKFNYS